MELSLERSEEYVLSSKRVPDSDSPKCEISFPLYCHTFNLASLLLLHILDVEQGIIIDNTIEKRKTQIVRILLRSSGQFFRTEKSDLTVISFAVAISYNTPPK